MLVYAITELGYILFWVLSEKPYELYTVLNIGKWDGKLSMFQTELKQETDLNESTPVVNKRGTSRLILDGPSSGYNNIGGGGRLSPLDRLRKRSVHNDGGSSDDSYNEDLMISKGHNLHLKRETSDNDNSFSMAQIYMPAKN